MAEPPKLYTNKPKKAQLKQFQDQKAKDFSSPLSSSSSSTASQPPPPPQPPKESFARRYKFLWPMLLTVNVAVGAYLFMRTKKKETDAEDDIEDEVVTIVQTTAADTAPVEKPLPSPTINEPTKLREPILESQQRELFKWILEEKRKIKTKDPEEKKRIDEEKAILKQFIRAKSIPGLNNSRLRGLRSFHTSPVTLPLGSLGLPFIGETIEFITCAYSDRPETFMNKRRRMYGKVFKSHIFGSPTIVSTDAEVSKFILQSDAKVFVPSYPKSLTELMGKSSILLINGSLQKRIHGLVGAFFKSPQLKAQITRDMQKYVLESMANWTSDRPIYVQDETKNIAFQVLVKALINLDPGEEMESLKKQFQEFIAGLMSLPINFPGTRLYRSLQAKKKMVKLVKKIIQHRKNSEISKVPRDVIDVLLNDSSGQLTEDLIADNMIDMMIPGEDSVPVLLTLAVKYLSDCPAALQHLMEENMKLKRLKEQLGEPLCWSDYFSLPFTQTVITETLRMGNVIVGVMRKAMRDVEIKGHLIPKGWCAFTYFRSVHLDESNYDWPYEFNPWRWQEKDTSNCNFTPFGGGQRLCPGLDLARLEASIFLHHFVTQFRWVAEEDTIVNFPTVRMKSRMPIWVKRTGDP